MTTQTHFSRFNYKIYNRRIRWHYAHANYGLWNQELRKQKIRTSKAGKSFCRVFIGTMGYFFNRRKTEGNIVVG